MIYEAYIPFSSNFYMLKNKIKNVYLQKHPLPCKSLLSPHQDVVNSTILQI